MDAIIQAVDVLPDYFEKFCSILNIMSCYDSVKESLVMCYIVYKSETLIKNYIDIEKVFLHFKDALTRDQLSTKKAGTDKCPESREDCFTNILKRNNPDFIDKLVKYLALKDCPNHSKLLHDLELSKDDFYKKIMCINSAVSYLPSIKRYQDFLKKFYTDMAQLETQDTIKTNINEYVNLSLITPQNVESHGEYFKALQDPHHLLFNHKKYTTTIPLNSLQEIFDSLSLSPQVILIQGSPGSGKTTLANEICSEWAKGNLIQHYILVILLKLRVPRISDIDCIDEVVKCSLGDSNSVSEVVGEINCIDGKSILLLLEGWDEFPEEKQHNSYFSNLISGKILKKCDVLITSRPSSIGSIQKRFITRHIAILGFSDDQIEQYLDHCFVESNNKLKDGLKNKFLIQLNSNPALQSLAYVPVNLSILVYVFTQHGGKLPCTLTELYQQYVLLKLSLYNQRISNDTVTFTELDYLPVYISESLNKLFELAYVGLKNQKLHFTQNEIHKLYQSIPLDNDGMGLLQVENHMLNRGTYKTYNFIHKTVQEFLAAWHTTKMPDKKSILENLQLEHFEMVLVFFAGLTGFKLFDSAEISVLIGDHSIPRFKLKSSEIARKVFIKTDVIKSAMLRSTNIQAYSEATNQHRLLVLIACCAEAKNPAACRAFGSSNCFPRDSCCIVIPDSAVTSHLLASLSYCIAHSGKDWMVECNEVLSNYDITNLQKYLTNTSVTSGKLVYLSTKSNKMAINLFVTFLQPHFTLHDLDLGDSDFDDDCVTVLCEELKLNCTVVDLGLGHCNISSKGVLTIARMLQVNSTLQLVSLYNNTFSSDDLIQVLVTMKSNTSLRVMDVEFKLHQEPVKKQLAIFNKNRRHSLMLNFLHSVRFKGLGIKVLTSYYEMDDD